MVETTNLDRVATDERANPTPQWEVFLRDGTDDPLRHVGSVAAESETEAHEHASRLFDRWATDVWLCPSDEVERYSTRGLAGDVADRDAVTDGGEESRVTDETEETSQVNDE